MKKKLGIVLILVVCFVCSISLAACDDPKSPETDTEKPVITIEGVTSDTVAWRAGEEYIIPTATATDNVDTEVAVTVAVSKGTETITVTDNKFTPSAGDYIIKYTATDAAANSAEKSFTLNVTENQKPVINLGNQPSTVTIRSNDGTFADYVLPILTVTDDYDKGELKASPSVTKADVAVTLIDGVKFAPSVGEHIITYSFTDSEGLSADPVTITVTFALNSKPVINVDSTRVTVYLESSTELTIPTTTITDEDVNPSIVVTVFKGTEDITSTIIDNKIISNEAAIFTVKYNYTDSEGLAADEATVTVEFAKILSTAIPTAVAAGQTVTVPTLNPNLGLTYTLKKTEPLGTPADFTGVEGVYGFTASKPGIYKISIKAMSGTEVIFEKDFNIVSKRTGYADIYDFDINATGERDIPEVFAPSFSPVIAEGAGVDGSDAYSFTTKPEWAYFGYEAAKTIAGGYNRIAISFKNTGTAPITLGQAYRYPENDYLGNESDSIPADGKWHTFIYSTASKTSFKSIGYLFPAGATLCIDNFMLFNAPTLNFGAQISPNTDVTATITQTIYAESCKLEYKLTSAADTTYAIAANNVVNVAEGDYTLRYTYNIGETKLYILKEFSAVGLVVPELNYTAFVLNAVNLIDLSPTAGATTVVEYKYAGELAFSVISARNEAGDKAEWTPTKSGHVTIKITCSIGTDSEVSEFVAVVRGAEKEIDFEKAEGGSQTVAGWYYSDGYPLSALSAEEAHTGKYSIKLGKSSTGDAWPAVGFDAKGSGFDVGKTFTTVKFWIYADKELTAVEYWANESSATKWELAANTWTQITITMNVASTHFKGFALNEKTLEGANVYIDDFSFLNVAA